MSSLFTRLSIGHRLGLIVVAALLAVVALVAEQSIQLRGQLMREKQGQARHLVETAHSVLVHFNALAVGGRLDPESARRQALDTVKSLRYGRDDYFWINDQRPAMVMHPFKPELDGKDLSGFKDPAGKRLFVEMVDTVRRDGAGFVDYLWPKPGHAEPVPKVSYVQAFEPWGWVVGSGIYVVSGNSSASSHH
jgi:methyl-accepting chemotaxis protein